MSWLKKFISYSKKIEEYNNSCSCTACSDKFQTAIIHNVAKKLKLKINRLNHIEFNHSVPRGLNLEHLTNEESNIVINDFIEELCDLNETYIKDSSNYPILVHLMRVLYYTENIQKFKIKAIYNPIRNFFNLLEKEITSG